MNRRPVRGRWAAVVALLVIIAGSILWFHFGPAPNAPPPGPSVNPTQPALPGNQGTGPLSSTTAPATPASPTLMPTAAELGATVANFSDPNAALQGVDQAILFYRRAFGENPVGQNEDITAAILGENPAHAAFLPPDSPAIKDGKLLDAWKTPYWFHPVSANHMEIRSAGPDKELFTSDDLILNK